MLRGGSIEPRLYRLHPWVPLFTFLVGNLIAAGIFKSSAPAACRPLHGRAGAGWGAPSAREQLQEGAACLVQGLRTKQPDGSVMICRRDAGGALGLAPAVGPAVEGVMGVVTGRGEALGLGYRELARLSEDTKRQYAELHGYGAHIWKKLTTEYVEWVRDGSVRLHAIKVALGQHEWVWWSDADVLVQNPAVRLETYVDDSHDIVLSQNWEGCEVSPASLLVRNSEVGWQFIAAWEQLIDDNPGKDDSWAINRLLELWESKDRIKVVAQYLINALPDMDLEPGPKCTPTLMPQLTQALEPNRYEEGDFAVNLEECLALRADPLQKYELGCSGLAAWYSVGFHERLDEAWARRAEAAARGEAAARVHEAEAAEYAAHLEGDPWNRNLGECTRGGSRHRHFDPPDDSHTFLRRWFKYDGAGGMFAKVEPKGGGGAVWKEFVEDYKPVATFEETSHYQDPVMKDVFILKDSSRSLQVRISAKKAEWSSDGVQWTVISAGGYESQTI